MSIKDNRPRPKVTKDQLLGKPVSKEYEPPVHSGLGLFWFHNHRPIFHHGWIEAMLIDPRVIFGLHLLKGPILAQSKFFISTKNMLVKQFLIDQIIRFWRNSALTALRSLDYGFLGTEVIYRSKNLQLHFDTLKFLHPSDTQVVTKEGEFVGILVRNTRNQKDKAKPQYIGLPKAFWTVHNRDWHRWYGRPRLQGAFLPWHEMWSQGGYRDQRRLWFFKNAFNSGIIKYPEGAVPDKNGTLVPNSVFARQLLDYAKTGHSFALPKGSDPSQEWDYDPPATTPVPEGLLEYGDSLRDEIFEGLGIPPEVAAAEGTGAFAGRKVPQEAFHSILQQIVQGIITDFDEQVLRNLVHMNFGADIDYEIEVFGLMLDPQEQLPGQLPEPGLEPNPNAEGSQPQPGQQVQLSLETPLILSAERRSQILDSDLMYHITTQAA